MESRSPPSPPPESDKNDREGGRQLAWLLLVAAVAGNAVLFWLVSRGELMLTDPRLWTISLGAVAAAVLAFVYPVIAIRLVTGRIAEIFDSAVAEKHPPPGSADPNLRRASEVLHHLDEGTPMAVVAAEHLAPSKGVRKKLGLALMIGGAAGAAGIGILLGVAGLKQPLLPELAALLVFVAIGGLVLWYRTL